MRDGNLQVLKAHIFAGPPATVFAILDGATVPDLPAWLASFKPEQICLYRGNIEPDMAEVAPYLVILERDEAITDWVLSSGWGKHWGIFGGTRCGVPRLRKHFRRFVTVSDETGRLRYFRFYDPSVLRVYLPICNAEDRKSFFGSVDWYFMEDVEPGNGRRFLIENNALREDRIALG